jgi:hypothetical protein
LVVATQLEVVEHGQKDATVSKAGRNVLFEVVRLGYDKTNLRGLFNYGVDKTSTSQNPKERKKTRKSGAISSKLVA